MLSRTRITDRAFATCFSTPQGAQELLLTITSRSGADVERGLLEVEDGYLSALRACGGSEKTQIFSRVYLSDASSQAPLLRKSRLYNRLRSGAVSVVGQPCLNGGPVCLFSYHVTDGTGVFGQRMIPEKVPGRSSLLLSMRNYSLLWHAGFSGVGGMDCSAQTQEVFASINDTNRSCDMSLLPNLIRTWVYVRDIDNQYPGMVGARREFFAAHGLTEQTRYPASTGIGGAPETDGSLVTVDALSIGGLSPEQVLRMDALDNMPRTIDYGVTFERGLRVRFGDRSHLHVSGTASIDKDGTLLHPGDVRKQAERTVENVVALLGTQGATLDDLAYILVYVRDARDFAAVREVLTPLFAADLPVLYLHAAVCRPAWLVEIEGVALVPDRTGFPDFR